MPSTPPKDKKDKSGPLVRGLKTAGKAALWTVSALIFPFKFDRKEKNPFKRYIPWKKMGVFILSWKAAFPVSAMLFPRAEEKMKQHGLDPALVQELAPGKKVYVLEDDAVGKTAAVLGMAGGPVAIPFLMEKNGIVQSKQVQAFTRPSLGKEKFFGAAFNDVCVVYLKKDSGRDGAFVTAKEYTEHTLLHEIRHCSDDNQKFKGGVLAEFDADYKAVDTLARVNNTPSLRDRYLKSMAIETNRGFFEAGDHDTTLYLDAMFRKVAPPSLNEMKEANKEAVKIADKWDKQMTEALSGRCMSDNKNRNDAICDYKADLNGLSPLALRRLELWSEANTSYMLKMLGAPEETAQKQDPLPTPKMKG